MLYTALAITTGIKPENQQAVMPFMTAALFADTPTEAVVQFLSKLFFVRSSLPTPYTPKEIPKELLGVRVSFPYKKSNLDKMKQVESLLEQRQAVAPDILDGMYEDRCVFFDRLELERLLPQIKEETETMQPFSVSVVVVDTSFRSVPIQAFDATDAARTCFSSYILQKPNSVVESVAVMDKNQTTHLFPLSRMATLFKEDIEAEEAVSKATILT